MRIKTFFYKLAIVIILILVGSNIVLAETYKVKKGDTLSKIARNYNSTILRLKQLNPQIKNIDKISIGQEITLSNPIPKSGGGLLLGGSTLPIAGSTYTLSGSGISSSATSLTLTSFTFPQTSREILDSDLSDTFYLTLEPGSRTKQEIISCTTVAQSGSDTTATLSGCTRGLLPFSPFTASTTYQFAHGGGTSVVLSNPPQFYEEFANRFNTTTITGIWTFDQTKLPRASSTPTYGAGDELKFATYGQVASTSYAGTVPASDTVAGLVMGATQQEMAGGTATGTSAGVDYILVPQNKYFNATSSATTTIPVTNGSGKIHSGFIATSSDYTWSGNNTYSGTSTMSGINVLSGTNTISGTTTISASTTISATTTFTNKLINSSGYDITRGGLILMATSSDITASNWTASTTIVGTTTIAAGELGTNNGLEMEVFISDLDIKDGNAMKFYLNYGGQTIGGVNVAPTPSGANVSNFVGTLKFILIANNSTSSQIGFEILNVTHGQSNLATSSYYQIDNQTISVNSSNTQNLTVTADTSTADALNSITVTGAILKKLRGSPF